MLCPIHVQVCCPAGQVTVPRAHHGASIQWGVLAVSTVKEIQQKAFPLTTSLWLQQVTGYQQNWGGCFRSWMGFEPPDQTHKTLSKTFSVCTAGVVQHMVRLSSTAPEMSLSLRVTSLYPPPRDTTAPQCRGVQWDSQQSKRSFTPVH